MNLDVSDIEPVEQKDIEASASAVANLLAKGAEQKPKAKAPADDRPHLGDMVLLGLRAPMEHRGAPAVVTVVAEEHCTVVVLDESRRFGLGECWPDFQDLSIECRHWRLDSRVRIRGLQGSKTSKLNSFCGTICTHKREGHPTFIQKPSAPDSPQLTLCVRLDEPELAGERVVLLEPRFLEPLTSDFSERHALEASGLGACAYYPLSTEDIAKPVDCKRGESAPAMQTSIYSCPTEDNEAKAEEPHFILKHTIARAVTHDACSAPREKRCKAPQTLYLANAAVACFQTFLPGCVGKM